MTFYMLCFGADVKQLLGLLVSRARAVFGLIDEAFETAGQTEGTIALALNVDILYLASPQSGVELIAEVRRVSQTKKTAIYSSSPFSPSNMESVIFHLGSWF